MNTPTAPDIKTIEMKGIVKQFPGVLAVDHVDFDVHAGEVHALLGENGAGKSTLMKILYGLYAPDVGDIFIDKVPFLLRSPSQAIQAGIGMIHQHFMLVPSLTVVENIALGLQSSRAPFLDLDRIAEQLNVLSETYGLDVDPFAPIWHLSVGQQQRVEILRALYKNARLLILDEPTAVLTPQEVGDLFQILEQMKTDGHLLIFISHKLHEVLSISDRVTVLRAGKHIDTIPTKGATKASLARMMVGREVVLRYDYEAIEVGDERLVLKHVSCLSEKGDAGLTDVNLAVHANEIVGVAGVSGNGQQELAQVIAGLRSTTNGTIYLDGQNISRTSINQRGLMGLSYVPEERMIDGVISDFSVSENIILQEFAQQDFSWKSFFLKFGRIRDITTGHIRDYEIKTPSPDTPVKSLSGGNIQKVVLARELSRNPGVLIAAQPTRGVDIGASEYIHRRLLDARKTGVAILLISEDLDEIIALADRILVMYEGSIIGELARDEIDIERIGLMMAGIQPTSSE